MEIVPEVLVLFPLQKVVKPRHPQRTCLLTFHLISSLSDVKFGKQGVFEIALCPPTLLLMCNLLELTVHIHFSLTLNLRDRFGHILPMLDCGFFLPFSRFMELILVREELEPAWHPVHGRSLQVLLHMAA